MLSLIRIARVTVALAAMICALSVYAENMDWYDNEETLSDALAKESTPWEDFATMANGLADEDAELVSNTVPESEIEIIEKPEEESTIEKESTAIVEEEVIKEEPQIAEPEHPLPSEQEDPQEKPFPSIEEQDDDAIKERIIQVGDKVIYRVIEDRDPPVTIPVLETGQIIVPYYGPIQVEGLTITQLTKKIERLLTKDLYEKATVILAVQKPAPASFLATIFLSGRVNRIGPMQIDPNKDNSLSKVILTAGGFADFADSSGVQIIRKLPDSEDTEIIEVDVKSIIEKGKLEKDVEVKDGDFIIVPQRLFNW